jgi:hypothetical protein
VIPKGEAVDLLPRPSNIMLLQKDLIRKYKLKSERVGSEANVHLRILPFQNTIDEDKCTDEQIGADDKLDELFKPIAVANGSHYSLDRLPLLPEN